MKVTFFETKNYLRLSEAASALQGRHEEVPGLGLIYGRAGLGKTKAAIRYAVHRDAIYLRANAAWSPLWMLQDLAHSLGRYPFGTTSRAFRQCVDELQKQGRLVFIDEADYLARERRLLDAVRDLHDLTGVPFILVGMDEVAKKMARHPQFWSRVSQVVEFKALTADEVAMIAKEWTGLVLEDGSLEALRRVTAGEFRLVTVALGHLERMVKASRAGGVSQKMVEMVSRVISRRAA
jgi:DNA transposition AAA+ family ATPase